MDEKYHFREFKLLTISDKTIKVILNNQRTGCGCNAVKVVHDELIMGEAQVIMIFSAC